MELELRNHLKGIIFTNEDARKKLTVYVRVLSLKSGAKTARPQEEGGLMYSMAFSSVNICMLILDITISLTAFVHKSGLFNVQFTWAFSLSSIH